MNEHVRRKNRTFAAQRKKKQGGESSAADGLVRFFSYHIFKVSVRN